jgi:hypothetical protein
MIGTKPGTSRKNPKSGEQNCRKKKLLISNMMDAKSHFSEAQKYPNLGGDFMTPK